MVVAFSGGVDSTFLLKVAKDVLRDHVVAVTVTSALQPRREVTDAIRIARHMKVRHVRIAADIFGEAKIVSNTPNRCYHCKSIMLRPLKDIADEYGYTAIEGTNYSDLSFHRPGLRAANRLGIRSPLIRARFTKEEIRTAARRMGLSNWNAPATACLATRIPYGHKIDRERLRRIDRAEHYMKRLGFLQVRMRDHFPLARIEIDPSEFPKIVALRVRIARYLRRLGYAHITLDLEGYRMGIFDRR